MSARPAQSGEHGQDIRAKVLCVDDDPVVQIMLSEVVHNAGADYQQAMTARDAEDAVARDHFDLILLDRRLPDSDGLLLIQTIRDACDSPVIVLSELSENRDRLLGIGLGAAEYMAKPFSPTELSSRIRYLLLERTRRKELEQVRPIDIGAMSFSPLSRRLSVNGETTFLPPAEARLLQVFMDNPGEALSRDELTRKACGREWAPGDRTVDVLVARLRRRIPEDAAKIITVHRMGYLLALPRKVD